MAHPSPDDLQSGGEPELGEPFLAAEEGDDVRHLTRTELQSEDRERTQQSAVIRAVLAQARGAVHGDGHQPRLCWCECYVSGYVGVSAMLVVMLV